MGNDIADINNDGYADILTLDMLPRDEEIIKTTAGEDSYDIYSYKLTFGYHHQFARNALQLNRGLDEEGNLLFSDIAPLAGLEATDWSWAPLLADFDNDGYRDAFIANGIVTRPNDLDYMNFIATDSAQRFYEYDEFIRNMPSGKVPNFLFRNEGDLKFRDVSHEWIGMEPSVSTGAVYADLDNDGDLDIAVNNVNEKAGILKQTGSPDVLRLAMSQTQNRSTPFRQSLCAPEDLRMIANRAIRIVPRVLICYRRKQRLSRRCQSGSLPRRRVRSATIHATLWYHFS